MSGRWDGACFGERCSSGNTRTPLAHSPSHHHSPFAPPQLEGLLKADGKDIDAVINFVIDDELVKERIGGRWIHKGSGRSYHTKFNPPKVAGVDDETGEPLSQRSDDVPETVGKRLEAFHAQTAPVLAFYAARSKMATIDAVGPIDRVWGDVKSIIDKGSKQLQ